MFIEKEFISENVILRGRWYSAQDKLEAPCIIMCHGTSATITMCLSDYASEFQKRGFNVFLFDHAGFGRSDGKERQTINPWVQAKGIADAVSFVKTSNDHHNGKIILWGDSFAGMLVLTAGAVVEGLTGIVSFTASCGLQILNFENPKQDFKIFKAIFDEGNFDQLEDFSRDGPMAVVSTDQENNASLLTPIQAFKWFIDQGGKFNSGWENRVTRVIPQTEVPLTPLLTAPFITAPVLMMVGKDDEMPLISRDVQIEVYDRIESDKELYEIDGGHFGAIYPKSEIFYEAISKQSAFINSIT
ncbi:MAG: alpha/beta fold hydrolase [Amylibacter sp.]|nr:alpha/beta fold hydrolase [Amylibacter sp.]MDG1999270.1 alpha/beta fold hydrolase [Amylibacter sp.]